MPTYTRKAEDISPLPTQAVEQAEEDSLETPIQVIENDNVDALARDLAFMNETVEVMVLPSHDKNDTTRLVSVSVNGKSYYMMRGQWQKVPRFVLEVLVRAKRESWQFGYRRAADGSTFETSNAFNILRYPHHFRDTNPRGAAWYDSIKDQVN